MPLLILAFFIADLLSIAFVFLGYHLWREWDTYRDTVDGDYAQRCLYGAIALALYIFLRKFLIKLLLSKSRKGEDEPRRFSTKKQEKLNRPDGTIINIEHDGVENGQPILFVHGLNANTKNWYYQVKHFVKTHRVILMDLPGLGGSTRPPIKIFQWKRWRLI